MAGHNVIDSRLSSSESDKPGVGSDSYVKPHSKPFRFKNESLKGRSRKRDERSNSPNRRHSRRQHHRYHRRSKDCQGDQPDLDPDSAFRESLFDALGDDEGAAFWEGVYGQPIHEYSNMHQNNGTGDLERMTDEEYTAFVRRKMWEKSREGVEALRQKRRAQQQEENAEKKARPTRSGHDEPQDQSSFDRDVDTSLERNRHRMARRYWRERWQAYLESWSELNALIGSINDKASVTSMQDTILQDKIAWPVASSKREDVDEEQVEAFLKNGPSQSYSRSHDPHAYLNILKTERIRWHPDKIQQRYGAMNVDELTLRGVTMVFQILDKLWNQAKNSP